MTHKDYLEQAEKELEMVIRYGLSLWQTLNR